MPITKLLGGLRALFHRQRIERELDEELRSFLEAAAQSKMRGGMSREEAWRAARVEMGSAEAVKDEVRSAGWESSVDTVWLDLRHAVRMLRKNPAFSVIAVLTLGLGIGANTAIFSLIHAVLLRMLPVSQPDELVQLQHRDPRWPGEASPSFTYALWEQTRDRQDVFSGVLAWGAEQFDLAGGGAVHYADGIFVSGGFFETLRIQPQKGRLLSRFDDRPGCPALAVLSYDFQRDHYGNAESAIGTTISLGAHPFEVIGVAPPGFSGLSVGSKFDVAVPICAASIIDGSNSRLDHRSWWWLNVMGRMKPGISRSQLAARLEVISPQVFSAALPGQWPPALQKSFRGNTLIGVPAGNGISSLRRHFDRPLEILMGVVGLVLLIACANFASLMMARSAARHKEIIVRQALGASRARLVRQLLTECVVLSFGGAAAGILIARLGVGVLVRSLSTARETVFLDVSSDGTVLAFTATLAVLTGILFGVIPAFSSTRVSLNSVMKTRQSAEPARRGRVEVRQWLVAGQVALSLVLLVAAGLLLRSFANLTSIDLGFDRTNVLLIDADLKTAKVPPERQLATFESIENRLKALPGVQSVARSVVTPIGGSTWNNDITTDWSKSLTGDNALAWFNYVSPGYFETLRVPLLAGRGIEARDNATGAKVAVVNETLARKFFPNLNPIGRTFRIGEPPDPAEAPTQVIGIIKDSKYETVREAALPTAFFPAAQIAVAQETYELRSGATASSLLPAVQAAVASVNKQIPLEFRTLAAQVDASLVLERLVAQLAGFFGILALLLVMIGLYGTLSYLVTQRQIEFGVRMALGAPGGSILLLVVRDVMGILAGGIVAGIGISLAATRLLQHMLFGLGARDGGTMIAAAGIMAAVALAAGYLPARRATKVDPMVALRYE